MKINIAAVTVFMSVVASDVSKDIVGLSLYRERKTTQCNL